MIFDENLAAIHGYLCADGYVIKSKNIKYKYYHIGFRNTNLILLRDFQKRFKKAFSIKPHLIKGERCRVGSKKIYKLLTRKFGSFYSREWSMPVINKKVTKFWLRAFFDCEAWINNQHHKNRSIGLDCVNETGLTFLGYNLKKLGIKSIIKKRNKREIYSLKIYGKENLIKFRNKIGFLHPEKECKLNKAISNYVKYDWDFPRDKQVLKKAISKIIRRKAKIKKSNGIIYIISNKRNNLDTLQKELNTFFNITCRVGKRINGLEIVYFKLNINKKDEVKELIKNKLLNKKEKIKWLKLKK